MRKSGDESHEGTQRKTKIFFALLRASLLRGSRFFLFRLVGVREKTQFVTATRGVQNVWSITHPHLKNNLRIVGASIPLNAKMPFTLCEMAVHLAEPVR